MYKFRDRKINIIKSRIKNEITKNEKLYAHKTDAEVAFILLFI